MIFTEQEREKLKQAADKGKDDKAEPEKPSVASVADRVAKRMKSLKPKTLGETGGYGLCPECGVDAPGTSRTRGGHLSETICGACGHRAPSRMWGDSE